MKKSITLVVFIVLVVVLANACKKDSEEDQGSGTVDCGTITTTFSNSVNPLMGTSCAKSDCHNNGSTNGPGPLTTYAQIFAARAQIRTAVANGSMPRDATFTAAQKATITCWIDAGAPNN